MQFEHSLKVRRALSVLGIAALCLPSFAQSDQDRPLTVRNNRALTLAFLRLPADPPRLVSGRKNFSISLDLSNDFRAIGLVKEDAETLRISPVYAQGFGNGWTGWAELPLLFRGGGILDPIIDWWHENVLRWSDPKRNSSKFGGSVITQSGASKFGSAGGFGDLTLGASKELHSGYLLVGAIKLPTGDAGKMLGSGNLDFAIAVSKEFALKRQLSLHAQLGIVVQGKTSKIKGTKVFVDQEMLALVWHPNSRDAWIVQWQSEAAPVRSGVSGADASHRIVSFAFRRKISSDQELELYFSEDRDLFNGRWPEGANIGADFSAGLRYSWRW